MNSFAPPPEGHCRGRVRAIITVIFAFVGAFAPIGVALYEHRVRFLSFRVIEILWPSSLVFFPDPNRHLPILFNALSVALNSAIFAVIGLALGATIDFFRFHPHVQSSD